MTLVVVAKSLHTPSEDEPLLCSISKFSLRSLILQTFEPRRTDKFESSKGSKQKSWNTDGSNDGNDVGNWILCWPVVSVRFRWKQEL